MLNDRMATFLLHNRSNMQQGPSYCLWLKDINYNTAI